MSVIDLDTRRPAPAEIRKLMPNLTRDERAAELEAAADIEDLSPVARQILASALACDQAPARTALKWTAFTEERGRWKDYEAGRPDFRDLEPERAEKRMELALADLLDGTDTHEMDGVL